MNFTCGIGLGLFVKNNVTKALHKTAFYLNLYEIKNIFYEQIAYGKQNVD